MKIRIAVAVDDNGNWHASGWGSKEKSVSSAIMLKHAASAIGGAGRFVWVEADIPDPEPVPVIQGRVTE